MCRRIYDCCAFCLVLIFYAGLIGLSGGLLFYLFESDFRVLKMADLCGSAAAQLQVFQVPPVMTGTFLLSTPLGHEIRIQMHDEMLPLGATCWKYRACEVTDRHEKGIPLRVGWVMKDHFSKIPRRVENATRNYLGCTGSHKLLDILEKVAQQMSPTELHNWLREHLVPDRRAAQMDTHVSDQIMVSTKYGLFITEATEKWHGAGQPQCDKVHSSPIGLLQVHFQRLEFDDIDDMITVAGYASSTIPGFHAMDMQDGNLTKISQLGWCRSVQSMASYIPGSKSVLLALAKMKTAGVLEPSIIAAIVAALVLKVDSATGLKVGAILCGIWLGVSAFGLLVLFTGYALLFRLFRTFQPHLRQALTFSIDFVGVLSSSLVSVSRLLLRPLISYAFDPCINAPIPRLLDDCTIGPWHSIMSNLELLDICALQTTSQERRRDASMHLSMIFPGTSSMAEVRSIYETYITTSQKQLQLFHSAAPIQQLWLLLGIIASARARHNDMWIIWWPHYVFWGAFGRLLWSSVRSISTTFQPAEHWVEFRWQKKVRASAACNVAAWSCLIATTYLACTLAQAEALLDSWKYRCLGIQGRLALVVVGGCFAAALSFACRMNGSFVAGGLRWTHAPVASMLTLLLHTDRDPHPLAIHLLTLCHVIAVTTAFGIDGVPLCLVFLCAMYLGSSLVLLVLLLSMFQVRDKAWQRLYCERQAIIVRSIFPQWHHAHQD